MIILNNGYYWIFLQNFMFCNKHSFFVYNVKVKIKVKNHLYSVLAVARGSARVDVDLRVFLLYRMF